MSLSGCASLVGISELYVSEEDVEEAPPIEAPPREAAAPPADAAHEAAVDLDAGDAAEDAPPVDAGDKRVFVTSGAWNGNMGGRAGADARCVAAADRARLGGDWIAWLSEDGAHALDRLTHPGPYVRLDGARVVRDKAQLVAAVLTSPIELDEDGDVVEGIDLVWTGTLRTGLFSADCNQWATSNLAVFGTIGTLRFADRRWTDNGGPGPGFRNWGCQTVARLYCFER